MSQTTPDSYLVHERRQRPTGISPVDVLTVQSQLVYGYAGNNAAIPPWFMLGLRVAAIPTALLANTPFYGSLRGKMLPTDWFADLLTGASERGIPQHARALVSGYLGTLTNGQAFADWVEKTLPQTPNLQYFLDPVIGDISTGPYVEDGLDAVFAQRLLPHAWLVKPNAFELGHLTGLPSLKQDDAIIAAKALLARGPKWVITHSVQSDNPNELLTLAVSQNAIYRWVSPYLALDVSGTGDVLMSLLVAYVLNGETVPDAVGRAIAGVHAALESTLKNNHEELDVYVAAVIAQTDTGRFEAQKL